MDASLLLPLFRSDVLSLITWRRERNLKRVNNLQRREGGDCIVKNISGQLMAGKLQHFQSPNYVSEVSQVSSQGTSCVKCHISKGKCWCMCLFLKLHMIYRLVGKVFYLIKNIMEFENSRMRISDAPFCSESFQKFLFIYLFIYSINHIHSHSLIDDRFRFYDIHNSIFFWSSCQSVPIHHAQFISKCHWYHWYLMLCF